MIFFITVLIANLGAQDTEEFFSRPAPNYPSHDPLLGWIDSRNSITLNGKWHYIVDPMNNGLPEESFFGGFPANKTQKNNLERVEFSFEDAETINLEEMGPKFENHPLFPERTNVQFASISSPDRIRMRVWERGVGVTLASGSSSCATAVSANRRGLTGKNVQIELDGGILDINWREDGVWMTGPTMQVFSGHFSDEFFKSL